MEAADSPTEQQLSRITRMIVDLLHLADELDGNRDSERLGVLEDATMIWYAERLERQLEDL